MCVFIGLYVCLFVCSFVRSCLYLFSLHSLVLAYARLVSKFGCLLFVHRLSTHGFCVPALFIGMRFALLCYLSVVCGMLCVSHLFVFCRSLSVVVLHVVAARFYSVCSALRFSHMSCISCVSSVQSFRIVFVCLIHAPR